MDNCENIKAIVTLLIEDNPGDVRLVKEAFQEDKSLPQLYVVTDGQEAMEFLHRQGKYSRSLCPHLILLDLNLPKKNGWEVLAEIKRDPALKHIPVVILTTSNAEHDILMAYEQYASCYIPKPVDLDHFLRVVRSIKEFWFGVVKLPEKR